MRVVSLGIAVALGCGPVVGGVRGDTDDDATTTQIPTETSGTTQGECMCGVGEVCQDGECEIDCSQIPVITASIEIQLSTPADLPIAALAFADVSPPPGAELLIARGSTIERVVDGVGTIVAQSDYGVAAFAVGDLDGDLVADLVVADDADGWVRLWRGTGEGFELTESAEPLDTARAIAIADHDGDGAADLYAHVEDDFVVYPTIDGAPLGKADLVLDAHVDAMGILDVGSDGRIDLAFAELDHYFLLRESGGQPFVLGETAGELVDTMVVADFSGDGEPDLAGLAAPASLMTFVGPLRDIAPVAATLESGYTAAAAADLDGDGHADLVILEPEVGSILVRYGAPPSASATSEPFRCDTRYGTGVVGDRIAAGDSNGDGRAELAIADGGRVVLIVF